MELLGHHCEEEEEEEESGRYPLLIRQMGSGDGEYAHLEALRDLAVASDAAALRTRAGSDQRTSPRS